MSQRPLPADPGIGREEDPIGSVGWAQRVRLHMQAIVNDVDTKPDALRAYVAKVVELEAWTLMNKRDGSFFSTWEEFCEYKQPWGLGRAWSELRPFVEAVHGKTVTAAKVARPAPKSGGKRRGAGRKATPPVDAKEIREVTAKNQRSYPNADSPRGETADYLAARIARDAPDVHEEMKAGKYPSVRAAAKAAGIVKDPDPVQRASAAIAKVPFQRLAELVSRLPDDVRKTLRLILLNDAASSS